MQWCLSRMCHAGDSDDGIVTRAALYLHDALQKGAKNCTLR